MKKLLMALFCVLTLVGLVACDDDNTNDDNTQQDGGEQTPAEATYKLGMGVVVSTASSKNGLAQVDATVATVVVDKDGKIVACRIDVAQNKVKVDENGALVNDITTQVFESKRELGDRYGMAGKVDNDGNGVKLEWYEQTNAFEAHVVGMTGAQVAAMETELVNGHYITTNADLLAAGCSMQITDFMAAVAKACADEQGVEFTTSKEFTLGVAVNSYNDGSASATADADGKVQVYSDFAATVVIEGKIAAALNDCIQPKFAVASNGDVTATFKATKRELKEEYGMAGKVDNDGNGVKLEWYVQSLAFSKHVVGMTGAQVAAMETELVNGHYITTNADLLAAGCSMQITGIQAVVAKAVTNAR